MGITWKSTMVLLSTLAALVIIVHSAEEDYDAQFNRREMRPRVLDTGTRRYEQPWRTIKDEIPIEPSTQDSLMEDTSSEDTPKRRRLGRKRKRRPDSYLSDVDIHRYFSENPVRPNFNSDNVEQEERPKRRRKKMERRPKWSDSFEEDRPVRRRGQRRHPLKDEPSQAEFSDVMARLKFHNGELRNSENTENDAYDQESLRNYRRHPADDSNSSSNERMDSDDSENAKHFKVNPTNRTEFSAEDYTQKELSAALYQHRLINKIDEKSKEYKEMIRKAQENGPIDILSLKDILKRSNGTSLSEILQQHNLSLTDLLRGKEMALSILKSEEPFANEQQTTVTNVEEAATENTTIKQDQESSEEKLLQNSETRYGDEPVVDKNVTTESVQTYQEKTTTDIPDVVSTEKPIAFRRFPSGVRRRHYIRPVVADNSKTALSKDVISPNTRKYLNRRRNVTKAHQWKDIIPTLKNASARDTTEKVTIELAFNDTVAETTTQFDIKEENIVTIQPVQESNDVSSEGRDLIAKVEDKDIREPSESSDVPKHLIFYHNPLNTHTVNSTGLRKQAYNNVLKKKRRKQKNTTTESPQDDLIKDLFGGPNLVSSSEFVARTQEPKVNVEDDSMLEDFMTTAKPSTKNHRVSSSSSPKTNIITTTEETAKIEIEEILNDTRTSARLSKILMERNMTLSELVEHRERGSSYVHLADIFNNTSREPNPPEPFLSKSLIEPISKETYPLRALLDANIHDTTTKATTMDPNPSTGYIHIPSKMDFGNNVNENAENMGIMSLFHNIKNNVSTTVESEVMKDSDGTLYKSSVTIVNTTDESNINESLREGREFNEQNENQDDIVTWNEIFTFMRKNYENQTKGLQEGLVPAESITKPSIMNELEDLMSLKNIHNVNEFDDHIETNFTVNVTTTERPEINFKKSTILNSNIPNHNRSITLATTCIVGLALVLFLLSYLGYKLKQHRRGARKKDFSEQQIPTPVFENRKGHKNNNSTRSISPMLTSNIYTLSTLDSQNGKESPDYMWDSLRKPFQ